ncbi:NgoMIV family type II restriction endonuclease [Gordonia sp. X0973]|uniref:NgoMIV family type II restriction endonuclease n=1 Tax=Gordonia sp. X0973 TaxID=2742602 RepID=UPI00265763D6|nr:NgoMIV family type II restriction endonuclease [Gordonia sp. X0973]
MGDPEFAKGLCGYRESHLPSTSDKADQNSIRWGKAMFHALGVPQDAREVPSVGSALEEAVVAELRIARPDLLVDRSCMATDFAQYAHLRQMKSFTSKYNDDLERIERAIAAANQLDPSRPVAALRRQLQTIQRHAAENRSLLQWLKENLAEESVLKLDVAVSTPDRGGRLLLGLSSKWSLRTDRAQDCVSQGGKLVSLRRGHMPHYAVVTMEPRPTMLRLLADGSGSVDCVYHVAFDALREAAEQLGAQSIRAMPQQIAQLDRMVRQGRIRPFSDLVREVETLPRPPDPLI